VTVGDVEPTEFVECAEPAAGVAATGVLLDWIGDLGPPDLGPPDLGPPDLGPPDLGPPDLGRPDLGRPGRLGEYGTRLARMARCLVAAEVQASEVSRLIASANEALAVRLLRLAEARLGPPPCPYAWLVLGSGGRQEQALRSDQDNALVYAEATSEAAEYFAVLADIVVAALLAAGFPRCPGGYMATTWRYTLDDWVGIFRRWVEQPQPQALVEAEVFLDFRRIHGQLSPWPLEQVLGGGPRHRRFLVHMARAAVTFRPPLGVFGRVRAAHHELDLKRGGIAAIVLLARLYALEAGSLVRPTADRLAAAAASGTLSHSGAQRLAQDYLFLLDLRLRTQLRRIAEGGQPDDRVRLDRLGPGEQHRLRSALHTVHYHQQAAALRFRTDAVS
jgi:CBS domain-containing protein